ncbi:MAG TPA: TIGR03086 family metal-binding protein, partial [Acidimicrobiales bacterium]|nr:TIGR03086 family metal-binding protein [Acidimicrobiales bacterium]
MAIDLHPAVHTVAGVLRGIPDDALDDPTPCPDYTVGDLIDHVHGFCLAFTAAAVKEPLDPETANQNAKGTAARLGDDWRERVPRRLVELAAAWDDPGAWEGTTAAGGIDLPGDVAGLISLDEVVVHGWDLAVATGQP